MEYALDLLYKEQTKLNVLILEAKIGEIEKEWDWVTIIESERKLEDLFKAINLLEENEF